MENIINLSVFLKAAIVRNQWLTVGILITVTLAATAVLLMLVLKKDSGRKDDAADSHIGDDAGAGAGDGDYGPIIECVQRAGERHKKILFTSVKADALPVTIPINVAIGLARSGKRCLLIDLDLKRDAVAKAFEINVSQAGPSPVAVKTDFQDLWIWPGHNFTYFKQMNIKSVVQKAESQFDVILINSPSLIGNPDRKQIISSAKAAFLCAGNGSGTEELADLINSYGCKVIDRIKVKSDLRLQTSDGGQKTCERIQNSEYSSRNGRREKG